MKYIKNVQVSMTSPYGKNQHPLSRREEKLVNLWLLYLISENTDNWYGPHTKFFVFRNTYCLDIWLNGYGYIGNIENKNRPHYKNLYLKWGYDNRHWYR